MGAPIGGAASTGQSLGENFTRRLRASRLPKLGLDLDPAGA